MLPNPPATQHMNPWIAGLIGFALGLLAAGAWFIETRLSDSAVIPANTETSTSTAGTARTSVATLSNGIIVVTDQHAGTTVAINSITVNDSNLWAAVEELRGSELGNVLGAVFLKKSATTVTVPLLRSTVPGTTYAIVLYRDNGDQQFNLDTDSIYVDFSTGQRVVALFKTIL